MTALTITMTAAQAAGLAKVVAEFNAQHPDDEPLTPQQYAQQVFGAALDSYADRVSVTASAFILRFTGDEIKAIRAAALQSPQLQAYLDELQSSSNVRLFHPSVAGGLQALEAAGLIAAGRAAEIMTP